MTIETTHGPPEAARPLFMFYESDAEEWVIAHDEDDATAIYVATGADMPDDGLEWQRLPPEKILKYDDERAEGPVSKTCAEWIAERGRGHWGYANR